MPLTAKITITVTASYQGAQGSLLGSPSGNELNKNYPMSFANGVGAGQADKIYHGSRTLAPSTSEDIDLAGTFLTDPLGATLTFAKIKAIVIAAAAGNANNVIVGGAASAQFVGPFGASTHTIAVKPGTAVCLGPAL